LILAVNMK